MTLFRHGFSPPVVLLLCTLGLGLAGCEGDDGSDGAAGTDGTAGADGINCWDLNQNGVGDLPDEDLNGDGVVDTLDCNPFASEVFDAAQLHRGYFAVKPYEDTSSCLDCHGKIGDDVITTGHFKWEGLATNIVSAPAGTIHGKRDIINNFCVAVDTNEPRCTQCHIGYGYADNTFDFQDPKNVDCLVCHDQTSEKIYAKAPTTAGLPVDTVDLNLVAQSVADNDGVPTIENCIDCHAKAGGGDNVKHGDLAMSLENTTRDFDVHMGTDGAGYECVECHAVKKDVDENVLSHGIGGMPYHSVDEGDMQQCSGPCHTPSIHIGTSVEDIVTSHDRLACQVCHIPTFARGPKATKVAWYWEDAGLPANPNPEEFDPVTGEPTWDRKKGSFEWANNVRPTLRYFNGKWEKFLVGENDVYTSVPAVLAEPVGDHTDPDAKIYPFKKMVGNQPADANNNTVLVPHLFGPAGDTDKFWGNWDWNNALQYAANVTGQPYSGAYEFVDTVMYLTVNHEVAPKEEAYGFGGGSACIDCHFADQIDWSELGWSDDPLSGGTRP